MTERIWTKAIWEEACCNYEEEYLVAAIKKYLRTPEQKALIEAKDSSIEDMLNGRVENDDWTDGMFQAWNAALGWKEFGS